ncbi:hypothetical protein DFJ77DRAFT_512296 [Powellomyces hirtus]|nr:hypothetical protein DFJ77DRAFT_512296 [Powellomyces hirtus]
MDDNTANNPEVPTVDPDDWFNDTSVEDWDIDEKDLHTKRTRIADAMYCDICFKYKVRSEFSMVQQARDAPTDNDPWWLFHRRNNKTEQTLFLNGLGRWLSTCIECTAVEATHHRCTACRKVKVKTEFSKTQLRNRKSLCARCIDLKQQIWSHELPDAELARAQALSSVAVAAENQEITTTMSTFEDDKFNYEEYE